MTNTLSDWIERFEYCVTMTRKQKTDLLKFLKGLGEGRTYTVWICPTCDDMRHYDFGPDHEGAPNTPREPGPWCDDVPVATTVSDGFLKGTKERLDEMEEEQKRLRRAGGRLAAAALPWLQEEQPEDCMELAEAVQMWQDAALTASEAVLLAANREAK